MTTRRVGIYGAPYDFIGGGQLYQAMVAKALASECLVDLIHHVPDLTHAHLARAYGVDLEPVRLRYVPHFPAGWPFVEGRRLRPAFDAHRAVTRGYDVFINVVHGPPILSAARFGVLLVLFPSVARPATWPWDVPNGSDPLIKRIIRNAYYDRRWRRVWAGYGRCVAISEFTSRWVKARWGLDAQVIYPPVRARYDSRPKENLIVSVGRITQRWTAKRQLEMVRTFIRVKDALPGWRFLCLGGLADDPAEKGYFEEVSQAARGHPIRIIGNPPDAVVKDAYERAALFWHAAGYGEDEELRPEHAEHFGMSTVEAMAAGCVPVVIRKGGQPEIVEHGSSGFLWDSLEELGDYTGRLAVCASLREDMAEKARLRSARFTDLDRFAARMLSVIRPESG